MTITRITWLIFLLTVWLMMTITIQAQPTLTAYFEVTNTRPYIGEPIEVVLILDYDDQIQVLRRPELTKNWGIFEVIDNQERQTVTTDGRINERQSFTIVAWQIGDHALPRSEVLYRIAGSPDLQTYTLPDVFFSIPSILTEESLALRPDEAPMTIPFLPIWAFFIGISVIMSIFIAIYQLWRYYARQNAIQTLATPPQDIFLGQLKTFNISPSQQENHTHLNQFMRDYLHARYGILAHEMTDTEIIHILQADGREPSYKISALAEILEHLAVGRFSTTPLGYSPEQVIHMMEAWVQNIHTEAFP